MLEIEGVYCKCEFLNPSGSIKARIAKYMIETAEEEGLLAKDDTIVEATSGNTGNALSMVAAVKGYRMLVVMPEGLSNERLAISRAYGAEVLQIGHFHVDAALEKARELGANPATFALRSSSRSGMSRRTAKSLGQRSWPNSQRAPSPTRW
jgi:cysteine synthase A